MRTFNLVTLILAFFTLTASTVFAADTQASSVNNSKELTDYTNIQTLLAQDNFKGIPEASKQLAIDAKANNHPAIAEKADKLAQTTDIKNARDVFVPLSTEMLPLAKTDKSKNFEIVYCPMKKTSWVQKTGPVANPFYGSGSEMHDCGVKNKN